MNRITRVLLTTLLLLPAMTFAQQVKETMVKKGKEKVPAFTVKYKHSKSLTRATVKESITEAGIKHIKHKKGFFTFKGAEWQTISTNKLDYYYKVTGNKRKSTIHFAVSKGYDNYITPSNDATVADNITRYLETLDGKMANKEAINDKQEELEKIEKAKAKKEKELNKLQTKSK